MTPALRLAGWTLAIAITAAGGSAALAVWSLTLHLLTGLAGHA
jgi:hypothetical protein